MICTVVGVGGLFKKAGYASHGPQVLFGAFEVAACSNAVRNSYDQQATARNCWRPCPKIVEHHGRSRSWPTRSVGTNMRTSRRNCRMRQNGIGHKTAGRNSSRLTSEESARSREPGLQDMEYVAVARDIDVFVHMCIYTYVLHTYINTDTYKYTYF